MENDDDIKKISATLKMNSSNEEGIEITLTKKTYFISFVKEDQSYLRDFFKDCIDELLNHTFEFEFQKDESIKNEIIIKVSEDYIRDLNKELASCAAEINKGSEVE